MTTTTRSDVFEHSARHALHVIGQAPVRGVAAGIAMIRILQIVRLAQDDQPGGVLEPVRPDEISVSSRGSDESTVRPRAVRRPVSSPPPHHRSAA
jgi:hypothetical protein